MTADFAERVIDWQLRRGRHDLPWQGTRDPYRIWVSEIMLQQTQVAAVRDYYVRFLERFPTLETLAGASLDEVLPLWAGLGYYSRARNLWACARHLQQQRAGRFPSRPQDLERLPGIGRSTAAAIAALAFGERAAILDGNVRRVLCRAFGVGGDPLASSVRARLWALAEDCLPGPDCDHAAMRAYTQGMMDLGATVCKRVSPRCHECPLAEGCVALREARVAELPEPRRRPVRPVREIRWLVLVWQGQFWLERRPERGVWGGLWAFPEWLLASETDETLGSWGVTQGRSEALEVIEHGFTHFVLRASPLLVHLDQPPRAASALRGGWLGPEQWVKTALPRPVTTLLTRLRPHVLPASGAE